MVGLVACCPNIKVCFGRFTQFEYWGLLRFPPLVASEMVFHHSKRTVHESIDDRPVFLSFRPGGCTFPGFRNTGQTRAGANGTTGFPVQSRLPGAGFSLLVALLGIYASRLAGARRLILTQPRALLQEE